MSVSKLRLTRNVFVVGTGRCGTSTFYHACQHATNYTVGHESAYWAKNSGGRLMHAYPSNHIEIGHTLTWVLSWLVSTHPQATFIHLQRERESCIESLLTNGLGPLRMFHRINNGCYSTAESRPIMRRTVELYYDEINSRIEAVIPPARRLHLWLHDAGNADLWHRCWRRMGCNGDFPASLAEWSKKYNEKGVGKDRTLGG